MSDECAGMPIAGGSALKLGRRRRTSSLSLSRQVADTKGTGHSLAGFIPPLRENLPCVYLCGYGELCDISRRCRREWPVNIL